jgi:hypothetical protein
MQQPNETDDAYGSTGSMLAHLYHQHGAKRVREEMTTLIEAGTTPRQFAEMVAAELRAARLSKVAELVESYLDQLPDGLDLRFCDYCHDKLYIESPGNLANIESWRRSRRRFMAKLEARRDKWLRLAGIAPE